LCLAHNCHLSILILLWARFIGEGGGGGCCGLAEGKRKGEV